MKKYESLTQEHEKLNKDHEEVQEKFRKAMEAFRTAKSKLDDLTWVFMFYFIFGVGGACSV